MSGVWGNKVKYSIFGESHGKGIGIVIDGLEPGIELDLQYIKDEMLRRAPGRNKMSTQRTEKDAFEILSGFFEGKTTGAPLCAVIYNNDMKSKDYSKVKDNMRPGHADYTGYLKYRGFNDYRGGGHFSGRITAPLTFAGSIAKQILERENIYIGSHINSIKNIEDSKFNPIKIEEKQLLDLRKEEFPVLNGDQKQIMIDTILKAKENENSVGGTIECATINLPAGIGEPFFDSLESTLAQLLFSIPAVKGVEFGKGFDITKMTGQEANDEYYIEDDEIKTYSNNNGGIIGGISNGMPLIFKVGIKPTPSISLKQKTINIETRENVELRVEGRHDPCIIQRAIPVIEAVTAMAILEHI
ncbi:chorismate synthase [Clostridium sp. DL1XJH146]